MTRIVVTGSTGQLGRAVADRAAAEGHTVLGLARSAPVPCDLGDRAAVTAAVAAFGPDLVIHAAGLTDVDRCERDPDACRRANVEATRHVAEAADAAGAHLLFVSTNHVFDGRGDRPFREDDPVAPLSAYGAAKVEGERLAGPAATVVRTSWVCAARPGNFVARIVELTSQQRTLRFVEDEVAQLTFVEDLAPVVLRLATDRRPGAWHVTNEGTASSYDIARLAVEVLGGDPASVHPISAADLPGRAPRPRNGALDTDRATRAGYGPLPPMGSALERLVGDLVSAGTPGTRQRDARFVRPRWCATQGEQVDQGSEE